MLGVLWVAPSLCPDRSLPPSLLSSSQLCLSTPMEPCLLQTRTSHLWLLPMKLYPWSLHGILEMTHQWGQLPEALEEGWASLSGLSICSLVLIQPMVRIKTTPALSQQFYWCLHYTQALSTSVFSLAITCKRRGSHLPQCTLNSNLYLSPRYNIDCTSYKEGWGAHLIETWEKGDLRRIPSILALILPRWIMPIT